jgi:hypothetical protein
MRAHGLRALSEKDSMEATLLTPAGLRDALGEPGSGSVHDHPRPGPLVEAQKVAHREAMTALLNAAEQRGDTDLRASEQRKFTGRKTALDVLAVYESELADSPAQRSANAFRVAGISPMYVTRENGTYSEHGEHGYFRELVNFRVNGDDAALNRVQRHALETEQHIEGNEYVDAKISQEQRDLSRTDGSGGYFVVGSSPAAHRNPDATKRTRRVGNLAAMTYN